jgi:protein phosphatase
MLELRSSSISDRGLNESRPINEDSLLEIPELGIFAVADGVGGAEGGEVASQMAVEILAEAFSNAKSDMEPSETLLSAIEQANSAIFQLASDIPQLEKMASTIAAAHIGSEKVTIAHVGDSRIYHIDRDGILHRETEDHSFVNYEVRAGRMTPESAEAHPGKNVINRALGASPDVEIDVKEIPFAAGEYYLLCTDGITGHVDEAEIRSAMSFGSTPADICKFLKDLCFDRGARDNLTAIVVQFPVETAAQDDHHTHADLLELDPVGSFETKDEPKFNVLEPVAAAAKYNEDDDVDDFLGSFLDESDAAERSAFGSILKTLALLLLGAAVGVGAFYLGSQNTDEIPAVPELPQMASDNIALTSFEKNRRNVDADPAAFLRELPPPGDAEDHYLIGRARLLTGDFSGAKDAFLEAKKGLAEVDTANIKTLDKEISIGLSIAETPAAQEKMKKEIPAERP